MVYLNILDRYFENIKMIQDAGASFTIEITPSDELEPYIEEIKKVMLERIGALPHITIGRKDTGDLSISNTIYAMWSERLCIRIPQVL